jgi:hypothetical protein
VQNQSATKHMIKAGRKMHAAMRPRKRPLGKPKYLAISHHTGAVTR